MYYIVKMILLTFCLLFTLHLSYGTPHISVYGDVFLNKEFFTKTFPWIVDNIGGDIYVEFYMLGSGRHTVPQMCALEQLRSNTFLQAQYLKCEAEGQPNKFCLCEAGIDAQPFKECVRQGGSLTSGVNAQYSRLKLDTLPIIELGYKSTVFEVTDDWYLKKICTLFLDDPPLGCKKPFECNATEVWNSKPGIAQIDVECGQWECNLPSTTTAPSIGSTVWYP